MASTLKERPAVKKSPVQEWPGVGESGEVPIDSVMPSWDLNPRDYFDLGALEELADDIKQNGQLEQGTVRLATNEERAKFPGVRYIIVSGERRWVSSKWLGKLTYDLRVKEYTSVGQEMLEAYLLNENRVQLCDLENALYIGRMAEANGWGTQGEIAAGIGRDSSAGQVYVSDMLAILRCTPKVQHRMRPQLKPDDRLKRNVAKVFSRLADEQQDRLIDNMPAEFTTSVAQVNWIKSQLHESGVDLPKRVRSPQNKRRMIGVLAKTVSDKSKAILDEPDLARLFENTTEKEAAQLAVDIRNALRELEKLVERVEKLSLGERPVTALITKKTAAAPKPRSPDRFVGARPAMTARSNPRNPPRINPLFLSPAPQRPEKSQPERTSNAGSQTFVSVTRWDNLVLRYVTDNVSRQKYAELWDENMLKFQREGTDKPAHYPDRAEIEDS